VNIRCGFVKHLVTNKAVRANPEIRQSKLKTGVSQNIEGCAKMRHAAMAAGVAQHGDFVPHSLSPWQTYRSMGHSSLFTGNLVQFL
jgi:hypothetical protein